MIINKNISKTTISGAVSVDSFKFELNEKAFQILTDGIYSNKIKAVIRELSTNAWDSHVAAKNQNPFDVHLPKHKEEYFFVRDYGIGLSEADIINVYTSFFTSTKDQTNEATGCLGLGSKSFFSYNTKSATIESFYNQVKYSYVFFINDEGIPSYAKVSEEPTTEPNGLKVQFAVNSNDIYTFQSEAESVYRWFDKKPNFIGTIIDVEKPERKYELDGIYLNDSHGPSAIMGNVEYPISFKNDALKEFDCFSNANIIIEFGIGDIDFSSSRESLAYTQKTILALRKKFSAYTNYLVNYFQNKIDASSDAFSAALEYEDAYNEILFAISDTKFLKLRAEYKGEKLITSMDLDCIKYQRIYGRQYRSIVEKKMNISSKYLYCVLEKGCKGRLLEYIKSKNKSAYILTPEQANLFDKKYLLFSSTLPKPERATYKSDYFELYSDKWISVLDKEIGENTYYVRKHPETHAGYSDEECKTYYSCYKLREIEKNFNINIIGFNKTQLKKKPSSIPLLQDFIDEESIGIIEELDKIKDLYLAYLIKESLEFSDYYPGTSIKIYEVSKRTSSDFLDLHNEIVKNALEFSKKGGNQILNKINILGIKIPVDNSLLDRYKKERKDATVSSLDLLVEYLEKTYVSV